MYNEFPVIYLFLDRFHALLLPRRYPEWLYEVRYDDLYYDDNMRESSITKREEEEEADPWVVVQTSIV